MRRATALPALGAFLVVALFYVWTARSGDANWRFGSAQGDYYNLLVHGFLKGQLSLDVEVPAELLAAADPYDPERRPAAVALHDASLYRGRYYIYFGVVPAVLALLPFRVLTGADLPLPAAVLGFSLLALAFLTLTLADLRRRFFSAASGGFFALVVTAVGFTSGFAVLIRRGSLYDLPIASGAAFALAATWCALRGLAAEATRRVGWIAASAVCWGLAIGARPIYVLAPAMLLLVVFFVRRETTDPRARWRLVLAAVLPLAVIGAALAWYNYARYGDPREFGMRYILSGAYESKLQQFAGRFVPWNIHAYFFAPLEWGRYFPFVHETALAGPPPAQSMGPDVPFGLLINLPFLWCVAALAWPDATRSEGERVAWRRAVRVIGTALAGVLGLLLFFYAVAVRYMLDFSPTLALLAGLGALRLGQSLKAARGGRRLAVVAIAAAAVGSIAVMFLFSVKLYNRVRIYSPRTFHALASVANAPVHAFERMRGEAFGPLVLRLSFPSAPTRPREELVRTGWGGELDRVRVAYLGNDRAQLEYEHAGAPPVRSDAFDLGGGAEHGIRIVLPGLWPVESDPMWRGWTAPELRGVRQRVRLEVDGVCVLERYQRGFETTPGRLRIGGADTEAFSGSIHAQSRDAELSLWRQLAARALPRPGVVVTATPEGALRFAVKFPAGEVGRREPLVVSGETGRGNVLAVEYLGPRQLRFVFDHWGRRSYLGPAVSFVPGNVYRVEVRHPHYAPGGAAHNVRTGPEELVVSFDGRELWRLDPAFYPMAPEDIFIGVNPLGGTTADEKFRGEITPD